MNFSSTLNSNLLKLSSVAQPIIFLIPLMLPLLNESLFKFINARDNFLSILKLVKATLSIVVCSSSLKA